MFKYIRLKNLLNAILEANSPQEVYQLTAEYIGGDTQVSGNISHKGLAINYHFVFDSEHQLLIMGLNVSPVQDKSVPPSQVTPIINFGVHVKEDQLPILQSAITSFLSLLR